MNENHQILANAIICNAAYDYRKALRGEWIGSKSPESIKLDCEKFFLSEWFNMLTKIDGKALMTMLQEEYEDERDSGSSNTATNTNCLRYSLDLLR